jgi:hypothetical protein
LHGYPEYLFLGLASPPKKQKDYIRNHKMGIFSQGPVELKITGSAPFGYMGFTEETQKQHGFFSVVRVQE